LEAALILSCGAGVTDWIDGYVARRLGAISKVGIEGSEVTSRIVQMVSLDQADLLDEELEFYSRDTVYEECLTMVGAFIRGTKHATRSTPVSHKVPSGEPISASQAREQRTRPAPRTRS